MRVYIRDIYYYPWQTDYSVVIEAKNEKHDVFISVSAHNGIKPPKGSNYDPRLVMLAIKEVKDHIISVRLD